MSYVISFVIYWLFRFFPCLHAFLPYHTWYHTWRHISYHKSWYHSWYCDITCCLWYHVSSWRLPEWAAESRPPQRAQRRAHSGIQLNPSDNTTFSIWHREVSSGGRALTQWSRDCGFESWSLRDKWGSCWVGISKHGIMLPWYVMSLMCCLPFFLQIFMFSS